MHVLKIQDSNTQIAHTGPRLHAMLKIFNAVEHTYIPDLIVCLLVMEDRWSSRDWTFIRLEGCYRYDPVALEHGLRTTSKLNE